MSKNTRPNLNPGGYVDAGPAVGKETDRKNKVLGDDRYVGDIKPETAVDIGQGYVSEGPGAKE